MNNFWKNIIVAIKIDRIPLSIFSIFFISALIALYLKDINGFKIASVGRNFQLFFTVILFSVGIVFIRDLYKSRPESPIVFSKNFIREKLNLEVIARHAPIVLSLCVFMPVFSAVKSSISLFADYSWDQTFINWDRALHFGDAWQLIHPLIGYPAATYFFNLSYNFWAVVIYAGTVFFALKIDKPYLRERFLITYFLSWTVLGILGAISFASVGPIFVLPLIGIDHFQPLSEYLYRADQHYEIFSLKVQEYLISRYLEGATDLGAGITAMPSMHVSKAFVFYLAMRHVSKIGAWALGAFVVLTFVGCVHLGYHYAIDGYASIVFTALLWKLAGWLVASKYASPTQATTRVSSQLSRPSEPPRI
jgi:PAP2 superfamily